ncbi:MAG: deoxyribonuclease IV [Candidatus Heimdallarchaeota archaeon]|nr:deoxyribonuclease IV [Candidatus Heimdallarchaeota archaeon]MCK4768869.1 deoxyribonuclease IV [Candidatus Heimdallarchaeota archaeon]
MVFRVGCHVSISGSVDFAFERARKLCCNTFQIFTKNPRGWSAKQLNENEIKSFRKQLEQRKMFPVISHISYLPNLASQNKEIYEKSINSFLLELDRSLTLDIPYFIIHGGSYKGGTKDQGIETYTNSILKGVEHVNGKTVILIENSSGGKNSVSGVFSDIAKIVNEIDDKKAVQVCFDTCHAFGAGYDLESKRGVFNTLEEMESSIGLVNVAVIHANDSKGELGSHRDYHEHIGLGKIGEVGFKELVNHPILSKKPWILETPVNETRGDSDNLDYLRMLRNKV